MSPTHARTLSKYKTLTFIDTRRVVGGAWSTIFYVCNKDKACPGSASSKGMMMASKNGTRR